MVRLRDLEPAWIATAGRHGMGISFLCPVHGGNGANGMACYLGVWFENPVDGGPAYKPGEPFQRRTRYNCFTAGEPLWRRTGETFDTLTLEPSIDAEGHWHGYIRAGEVQ